MSNKIVFGYVNFSGVICPVILCVVFDSHTIQACVFCIPYFSRETDEKKHQKVYMIVGSDTSLQPPGVRLRALTRLVVQFKSWDSGSLVSSGLYLDYGLAKASEKLSKPVTKIQSPCKVFVLLRLWVRNLFTRILPKCSKYYVQIIPFLYFAAYTMLVKIYIRSKFHSKELASW